LWTDFDEIFWRGSAWLKDQVIQFWWRSGSRFGSGSPKSEICILQIGGGLCSLSTSSLLSFLFFCMTDCLSVCPSVHLSVILVDCDHTVQQKVKIGTWQDMLVSAYLRANVSPDCSILWSWIPLGKTTGAWKCGVLHFASNNQWLTHSAVLASFCWASCYWSHGMQTVEEVWSFACLDDNFQNKQPSAYVFGTKVQLDLM